MNDDALVLYILMRTDLDSMNPGKAMAQASHAYGAFKNAVLDNYPVWGKECTKWCESTPQNFGTTIVLGGNEGEIQKALDAINWLKLPVLAGWVHDPTYPIRDGGVTHLIPLNTCAFVFGSKIACSGTCDQFELHS